MLDLIVANDYDVEIFYASLKEADAMKELSTKLFCASTNFFELLIRKSAATETGSSGGLFIQEQIRGFPDISANKQPIGPTGPQYNFISDGSQNQQMMLTLANQVSSLYCITFYTQVR